MFLELPEIHALGYLDEREMDLRVLKIIQIVLAVFSAGNVSVHFGL